METINSSTLTTVLMFAALGLWIARVVIFGVLHGMRPPAHIVADTVSDYANGRTKRLYSVMSVVTAFVWVTTALLVVTALPGWDYRWICAGLLLVAAVTPLAMLAAPIPEKGKPLGVRGVVHYGLAILNFAAAYSPTDRIAALTGSPVLAVLHTIGLVGLIAFCVALVLPKLRGLAGLLERVFLWAMVLFYLVFTILLIAG